MPLPLVIIHGWSDSSASFQKLAAHVKARRGGTVSQISLADYISMSDEVTFRDLAAAMANAWKDAKLPTSPGSVDAIVHSTGGLVIRDWLSSYYTSAIRSYDERVARRRSRGMQMKTASRHFLSVQLSLQSSIEARLRPDRAGQ